MNKTYYPNWNKKDFAKIEYLQFYASSSSTTNNVFGMPITQIFSNAFPNLNNPNKYLTIKVNGIYTGLDGSYFTTPYWIRTFRPASGSSWETTNEMCIGNGSLTNSKLYLFGYQDYWWYYIPSADITSAEVTSGNFELKILFNALNHGYGSENNFSGQIVGSLYINDVEYTDYSGGEAASIQNASFTFHPSEALSIGGGMKGKITSIEIIDTDTSTLPATNTTVLKLTPAKNNNSGYYGFYDEISNEFYPLKQANGIYTNFGQGPVIINNWK